MLHLIFQSPIQLAVLQRIEPGDVVVFLENSVFRILKTDFSTEMLMPLLVTNRLCVLTEDLIIRGIEPDRLLTGIDVIEYSELVDLSVKHPVIQSWLQ